MSAEKLKGRYEDGERRQTAFNKERLQKMCFGTIEEAYHFLKAEKFKVSQVYEGGRLTNLLVNNQPHVPLLKRYTEDYVLWDAEKDYYYFSDEALEFLGSIDKEEFFKLLDRV